MINTSFLLQASFLSHTVPSYHLRKIIPSIGIIKVLNASVEVFIDGIAENLAFIRYNSHRFCWIHV